MKHAKATGAQIPLAERLHNLPFGARLIGFISLGALTLSVSLIGLNLIDRNFFVSIPERGGKLTEGLLGRPHTINPVIAKTDADRDLVTLIYSGLFRPKGSGLEPDIASGIEVSNDGKTYTITIKDAAIFHDGTPVTADDVAYTVDRIKNKTIKSPLAPLFLGVTAAAQGAKTVIFTLDQPHATFPDALTFGILPKHAWMNIPDDEFDVTDYNWHPIGSGPYKFKDYTRDKKTELFSSYDLESFKGYVHGEPYIKDLHLSFYGNDDDRMLALENGDIDTTPGVDVERAAKMDPEKITLENAPMPRIFGIYFNQSKSPVLADPIVRQALDLSLPRESIVHEIFHEHADREIAAFPGIDREKLDSDNRGALAASALLEQNGWTRGEDRIYQKIDRKTHLPVRLAFTLTVRDDFPEISEAADLAAKTWKTLGLNVEKQSYGADSFNDKVLGPRNFEALFYGEVTGRGIDPYPFWHSSQKTGANIAGYTSKTADGLIEQLAKTTDTSARAGILSQIAGVIEGDRPAIFALSPKFLYANNGKIHGMDLPIINTASDRFSGIESWYINQGRVWKFLKK